MKDDVINSALKQMQFKEMKKKEEEANDAIYKQKLLEKYAQDEKVEKDRQEKLKQKLIDIQNEIQKQRELKYLQYQKQKEKELYESIQDIQDSRTFKGKNYDEKANFDKDKNERKNIDKNNCFIF